MKTTVRPLSDVDLSGRGAAQLDTATMTALGVAPGDLVTVDGGHGRPLLVRLAEATADPTAVIQLDRWARRAGDLRTGSLVEVVPARSARPAAEVVLRPVGRLGDDDADLAGAVARQLAHAAMPVAAGGIVHVRFHADSAAGMPYEVVTVNPGPGWVVDDTRVRIRPPEGAWREADVAGFEDVGGLVDEIGLLRELVALPLTRPQVYRELGISPPRGVILHGPPGTGKTRLVQALAHEVAAACFHVNGPEIVGGMYGETESTLRTIFGEAVRKAPSVIFIDELDALAPQRDRTGSHSDARIVAQLLSLMDGVRDAEGMIVVGTTNRLEAVDRAFRRAGRFDREIFVGPPSEAGRLAILSVQTRQMPLSPDALAALPEVAHRTVGFVGADLKDLCRAAALRTLRRTAAGGDLVVDATDLVDALDDVTPAVMRSSYVTRPETRWDDLTGVDALRDLLLERATARLAGHPGKGLVLHGPTGAGKTALAHALADRCGVTFLTLTGGEVFSKWLGESEAAVREIFAMARQYAPAILFLDQVDAIAPGDPTAATNAGAARVLSQLQRELDDLADRVFVVGAADRLDAVHPAVVRRGRLGTHVAVPHPDASTWRNE